MSVINAVEETKKKDLIYLKYQGRLSKEKIFNLRLAVGRVRGWGKAQSTAHAKALSWEDP